MGFVERAYYSIVSVSFAEGEHPLISNEAMSKLRTVCSCGPQPRPHSTASQANMLAAHVRQKELNESQALLAYPSAAAFP